MNKQLEIKLGHCGLSVYAVARQLANVLDKLPDQDRIVAVELDSTAGVARITSGAEAEDSPMPPSAAEGLFPNLSLAINLDALEAAADDPAAKAMRALDMLAGEVMRYNLLYRTCQILIERGIVNVARRAEASYRAYVAKLVLGGGTVWHCMATPNYHAKARPPIAVRADYGVPAMSA